VALYAFPVQEWLTGGWDHPYIPPFVYFERLELRRSPVILSSVLERLVGGWIASPYACLLEAGLKPL
jgi:hypothetical protein